MSSAAKSRPGPRTLERVSSESHVLVVLSNGRAPILVLRLSEEPTQWL
jgi:hypothetical protein